MKSIKPATLNEHVSLVIFLPAEDFSIYVEAHRILKCLMGRKAPRLEKLMLHDLRGRDAPGIADNYLDSVRWPLGCGRAVNLRMRERARRVGKSAPRSPRTLAGLGKPPGDPARN